VNNYLKSLETVKMLEGDFKKVLERMKNGLLRHAKDISYGAYIIGAGPTSTENRPLANALYDFGMNVIDWDCGHLGHTAIRWRDTLSTSSQRVSSVGEECNARFKDFDFRYPRKEVNAILDTPTAEFFWDLYIAHPNAKFILTTRDSYEWSEYIMKKNLAPPALQRPCGLTADMFTKEMNAKIFETHLDFVRCLIPKEKLLEICIPCGDIDYRKIGDFIGRSPRDFGLNETKLIERKVNRKNFIHRNDLDEDFHKVKRKIG